MSLTHLCSSDSTAENSLIELSFTFTQPIKFSWARFPSSEEKLLFLYINRYALQVLQWWYMLSFPVRRHLIPSKSNLPELFGQLMMVKNSKAFLSTEDGSIANLQGLGNLEKGWQIATHRSVRCF